MTSSPPAHLATMTNTPPKGGLVKKPSRKECEKMRRDKLNRFIGELAEVVPLIKQAKKKLNKTAILRLTVNYLRQYHDLRNHRKQTQQSRPPYIESNFPIEYLESNNSFLFVYNSKGILTYISENVLSLLGHSQIDLLGQSISKIVHSEFEDMFLQQFNKTERSGPTTFSCKMSCSCQNSHLAHYEDVLVTGNVRQASPQDIAGGFLGAVKESYFVGVGKVESKTAVAELPPTNLPPLDLSSSLQYITRHYIDGSVENMDYRASMVLGYLSGEAQGRSPYFSIHPNDLVFVAQSHQRVFEDKVIQSTAYRYITCEHKVLHIESQSHLIDDPVTGKPKLILSFNNILPPTQGRQLILRQRETLIKERKALRRAKISNGVISDQVDKDDEGAVVNLVYEESHMSISVPFGDFQKVEMKLDDLVISDASDKEQCVTETEQDCIKHNSSSNATGPEGVPYSVDLGSGDESSGYLTVDSDTVRTVSDSCSDLANTDIASDCSESNGTVQYLMAATGSSSTGMIESGPVVNVPKDHDISLRNEYQVYQESGDTAASRTYQSNADNSCDENFFTNLNDMLTDLTNVSPFSLGTISDTSDILSPLSSAATESCSTDSHPISTATSPPECDHQDVLPKCHNGQDIDHFHCKGSCNLKAIWPEISQPSHMNDSTKLTFSESVFLSCSPNAPSCPTEQPCPQPPSSTCTNPEYASYNHSGLRALLEMDDP